MRRAIAFESVNGGLGTSRSGVEGRKRCGVAISFFCRSSRQRGSLEKYWDVTPVSRDNFCQHELKELVSEPHRPATRLPDEFAWYVLLYLRFKMTITTINTFLY
jgi:hypothetical protein